MQDGTRSSRQARRRGAQIPPGSVCEELLSDLAIWVETVIHDGTLPRSARPPDLPDNSRRRFQGWQRQHARSSYVRAAVRSRIDASPAPPRDAVGWASRRRAEEGRPPGVALTYRPLFDFAASVQDPASAALGPSRFVLLGGLTAADTSTDAVVVAGWHSSAVRASLPNAQHDAEAAALGGRVYAFGGGQFTSTTTFLPTTRGPTRSRPPACSRAWHPTSP